MFKTALNTIAKAKLVHNKKLDLYKLVIAFNVTQRSSKTQKFIFPSQAKCAYVSGDIALQDVANILQKASTQLRTTNIVLVD